MRSILLSAAAIAGVAAAAAPAFADHLPGHIKSVHNFKPFEGESLSSALTTDGTLLYCTAPDAKHARGGLVYSVDPASGALSILHVFGDDTAGAPYAAPVVFNGKLWGATDFGGGVDGSGAIYSIDLTTGAYSLVHGLSSAEGTHPLSSLVPVNGLLYGTTADGGAAGEGAVYALDPSTGNVTNIYSFTNSNGDGWSPVSEVLFYNGALYGTTQYGGNHSGCGGMGCGTIYKIDLTTNQETVLYSFTGGDDGGAPAAGLALANGMLYGVTQSNGGMVSLPSTVFKIDPDTGAFATVHTMTGAEGGNPLGTPTLVNGLLYGTNASGGHAAGGVIFTIDPISDAFTVVHNVSGAGKYPNGLLSLNGALYGTTYGPKTTVFEYSPPAPPAAH